MNISNQEKERIKLAVAELERNTAGELVPVIVRRSDDYKSFSYMSALFFAISAMIGALASYYTAFYFGFLWSLSAIGVSTLFGFILPILFPVLKRELVPSKMLSDRVFDKACQSFIKEEVFNTEDRIGILIFVSYFERKVFVLGDTGINQKLKHEDWNKIVQLVIEGIKSDQLIEGLEKAIKSCEKLLLEHGFTNRVKEHNELSDDLRVE